MGRSPRPWYWKERNAWYVIINGKRYKLGTEEKEALRRFHEILASPEAVAPKAPVVITVGAVLDLYLEWCKNYRAAATYRNESYNIQRFVDAMGKNILLPDASLRPFHVLEWIDAHPNWSSTYKNNIIQLIRRAHYWALKRGYIDIDPLLKLEAPPRSTRKRFISVEDWPSIRDFYQKGDPFRNLIEFMWETGCRPQEVRKIEPRHVDLARHCVTFPKEEAKGKKRARNIFLTPLAEDIIKELLARCSGGVLFLNSKGRMWSQANLIFRFRYISARLGKQFCTYELRHGFATRKLEEGLDHFTVAELLGHSDASMLARVYSHLRDRHQYLWSKLNGQPSAAHVNMPES